MEINKIALTVDMEDWYHGIISYNNSIGQQKELEKRFVNSTQKMLKFFSERNVKATFFVLASLANEEPNLIREMKSEGHEIASHGWSHQLVYNMKPQEFENDIYKAKNTLEEIIQDEVLGYRAPYFSITNRCMWAVDKIESAGYKYDSSICPFKNFIYGIKNVPRFYYYINQNLLEIPPSCLKVAGQVIPWTGGLYFRVFPYLMVKKGINIIKKHKKGTILYFHTADFDLEQPKANCSKLESFIHYAGLKSLPKKMNRLLNDFKVIPVKEAYKNLL